jgi:hypothetical protein
MFDNDDIQAMAAARHDGFDGLLYEKTVAELVGGAASCWWMPLVAL